MSCLRHARRREGEVGGWRIPSPSMLFSWSKQGKGEELKILKEFAFLPQFDKVYYSEGVQSVVQIRLQK